MYETIWEEKGAWERNHGKIKTKNKAKEEKSGKANGRCKRFSVQGTTPHNPEQQEKPMKGKNSERNR
jgi:hypothetical protein